jgi:Sec-independent protein translocase protein TatA
MNEFMKFLQKFRKQNPTMTVPEAAKAAGKLYREGKRASHAVSEVVVKQTKKLRKKKKQTRRKRRGSRRGSIKR